MHADYQPRTLRVALVDDAFVVRDRLAAALAALEGVEVVGEAVDVAGGARLVREQSPDVLILDVDLAGQNGIDLLELVVQQPLPPLVMMLTAFDHPKIRQKCAELGAAFFFHKATEFEKVLDKCAELAGRGGTENPKSEIRNPKSGESRKQTTEIDALARHESLDVLEPQDSHDHAVNARVAELVNENAALRQELAASRRAEEKSRTDALHFIAEQKDLEAQFLRSQRLESVGNLAAGITHDLNNVLAPIIMSCELYGSCTADEDRRRLIKVIRDGAQRGADLVKQILAFSRGVEGRRGELGVGALVQEVANILRGTLPKSVRFETELATGLWPVMADATQLHQVLINLCVNARDAMPNGGTLRVSTENALLDGRHALLTPGAKPRPHVVISVADTGTGISPELREKIFEPFFTTKAPGKGTGLGLSTSVAIVKNHGGFIEVQSEPGRGTVFRVHLPALTATKGAGARAADAELPRGRGELVLLVDDEAAVRSIAQQTLQAFGYSVLTAGDGAEALALYEQHRHKITVLLMDMTMPVMDGPASIQAVRRINPELRIIAVSGLPSETQMARARGDGATAFLPKPYTTERLLRILDEVLRGAV